MTLIASKTSSGQLASSGWFRHSATVRLAALSREMGLQLRNKTPKRRVKAKLREARSAATGANEM